MEATVSATSEAAALRSSNKFLEEKLTLREMLSIIYEPWFTGNIVFLRSVYILESEEFGWEAPDAPWCYCYAGKSPTDSLEDMLWL